MLLMHLTDSYGILLLEAVRLKQLSFFSTSSALNSLQEFCSDLSERGIVDNSHPQDVDKNGFQSLATLPNVLYAGTRFAHFSTFYTLNYVFFLILFAQINIPHHM